MGCLEPIYLHVNDTSTLSNMSRSYSQGRWHSDG